MKLSRLHWSVRSAAIISAILAIPGLSLAYTIECVNNYAVYKCNDGTIIECGSSEPGNPQIDCEAGFAAEVACGPYGGFASIEYLGGETALVAEYKGAWPIQGSDRAGEVNSIAHINLIATCEDGATFTCDDENVTCPGSVSELKRHCASSGGISSISVYLAFSPMSDARR
ncbi:hypothetical protein WMF30_35835 [Sorangium sp. So ce134]